MDCFVAVAPRNDAFNDDFRGIPLTVSLHGIRFELATTARRAEAPQVVSPPLAAAS